MAYSKVKSTNPRFVIDWVLSNVCNYDCIYCSNDLKSGSEGWPTIDQAVHFINKVIAKHGALQLIISGGEPTLWRDLPKFLGYVKESDVTVKIITNGFRKGDYWQRVSKIVDSVIFSLHVGQIPNIDRYIENFNSITVMDKTILLLAWPDDWDKVVEYHARVMEGIDRGTVQIKPIDMRWLGKNGVINYDSDQLKFIESNLIRRKDSSPSTYHPSYLVDDDRLITREIDQSIIIDGINSFVGWKCNIGLEKLTVMQNGDIYAGTCGVGGRLGNYKDGTVTLPDLPQLCNMKYCNCMPDLLISKER